MAQGKVLIHIGPYGSGKTELSLNSALSEAAAGNKVLLIDLDIVNPFFRSGEHRAMLEAAGVRVIAPLFVNTTVEVPAIPPEVAAAFTGAYDIAIFDVGGDPAGATALGRYNSELQRSDRHVRCVVNARRPFTGTAEEIVDVAREMEARGRVQIMSLVNNTNLARETTPEIVLEGEKIVLEAARLLKIPLEFTSARDDLADAVAAASQARVVPLENHIKPLWL